MSAEQNTIPTPSGDPFYDALIKRLWLKDGSVEYPEYHFAYVEDPAKGSFFLGHV